MIVAQDPEKNAKHTIAPENDRAAIICLSPSSDAGNGDYYSGTLLCQYATAQAAGFLAAVAREIEPPVSGAFGIAVGVRTWPAAVPVEWRLLRPQRHAGRAGGGDPGGSADFTSSRPPNRTRLRAPSGRVHDAGPPRSPAPVNIAAGAGSLSTSTISATV